MAQITKSVGKGGVNDTWDVMTVQLLLNKFLVPGCVPGVKPLAADGACGNKTIAAIIAFQKAVVGMNWPDGKIDPGGKTLGALNGPLKWGKAEPAADTGCVRAEKMGYGSEAARLFDFDVDEAELKPGHKLYLTSLKMLVNPSRGRFLIIHGLTSRTGTEAHNYQLSRKRMAATREYLLGIGVPMSSMCLLFNGEDFAIGASEEDPLDRAAIVAVTTPPKPTPKYAPIIPPWPLPTPDDPIVMPDDDEQKFAIRMLGAWDLPTPTGYGGSGAMSTYEIRDFRAAPLSVIYEFVGLRVSKSSGWSSMFRGKGPWNVFRFPEPFRVWDFGGHMWYSTFTFGALGDNSRGGVMKILPMNSSQHVILQNPELGLKYSIGGSAQLVTGALMRKLPPTEFRE